MNTATFHAPSTGRVLADLALALLFVLSGCQPLKQSERLSIVGQVEQLAGPSIDARRSAWQTRADQRLQTLHAKRVELQSKLDQHLAAGRERLSAKAEVAEQFPERVERFRQVLLEALKAYADHLEKEVRQLQQQAQDKSRFQQSILRQYHQIQGLEAPAELP